MELPKNQIVCGDTLTVLKTFPDESVDCVVCSPPYFRQRDYGMERQIGMEKTHTEYISKLVEIFDEVKRVLTKNGTCFVNLGDSYGSGTRKTTVTDSMKQGVNKGNNKGTPLNARAQGFEKCLMMLPERFAISMIDNGWTLRNKIVWCKINSMPESILDRWKRAHEYIFFFTQNRNYYFDLDSIRTAPCTVSIKRVGYEQGRHALGKNPSSIGEKYNKDNENKGEPDKYYSMPARIVNLNPKGCVPPDYFIITTNSGGKKDTPIHFATFPPKLITPLIFAGCPEGGIVLDIFVGSGTTAIVAKQLNRNYIGIDINPEYCKLAEERLRKIPLNIFSLKERLMKNKGGEKDGKD